MPDVQIVSARPEHIRTIAKRMRKADREEVAAISGKTPGAALCYSLRKSTIAWTAIVDGRPELIWGVADLNILSRVGAPWLLGTDVVEIHFREFLRRSVWWRGQLLQRYAVLRNFVDDRNAVSIRWLKWLGFTMTEPVDLNGHKFRLFELRQDNV